MLSLTYQLKRPVELPEGLTLRTAGDLVQYISQHKSRPLLWDIVREMISTARQPRSADSAARIFQVALRASRQRT